MIIRDVSNFTDEILKNWPNSSLTLMKMKWFIKIETVETHSSYTFVSNCKADNRWNAGSVDQTSIKFCFTISSRRITLFFALLSTRMQLLAQGLTNFSRRDLCRSFVNQRWKSVITSFVLQQQKQICVSN